LRLNSAIWLKGTFGKLWIFKMFSPKQTLSIPHLPVIAGVPVRMIELVYLLETG